MLTQLVMGLVVEALDRCFLDRPVHPADNAASQYKRGRSAYPIYRPQSGANFG